MRPVPPAVGACAQALRIRFSASVVGILFYGGGLRSETADDDLLDFYVVVDDLHAAVGAAEAMAGTVLPPNVYMVDVPYAGKKLGAKVAVIGKAAFLKGMRAFTSHLWARFAQPAVIVEARSARDRAALEAALATAVRTLIAATLPLMPPRVAPRDLWVRALQECYAAELRPEQPDRAERIVAEDIARYEAVTAAVLGPAGRDGTTVNACTDRAVAGKTAWWLRRRCGKTLNLLRLMKAAFTFTGGLDYAVAKIARHTGVEVKISDRDRQHPLLAGIRVFLEARWRGGVR
jgi:hypothetical protein